MSDTINLRIDNDILSYDPSLKLFAWANSPTSKGEISIGDIVDGHNHNLDYAALNHLHSQYIDEAAVLTLIADNAIESVSIATYIGNAVYPRTIAFDGGFVAKCVIGASDYPTGFIAFPSTGLRWWAGNVQLSTLARFAPDEAGQFVIPSGSSALNAAGYTFNVIVLG